MTLLRMRKRLAFALGALVVSLAAIPSQAQDGRFLAKEDILLYGLGLRVEPARQTVPKDIATIVSTYLQAPTLPQGQLSPFAPDAVVKAMLRGPGFQTPLELTAAPNTPFNIPPLTIAGTYTLDNIRLVSGGSVLLRGSPESATIEVIEKLLVTEITARPLSAAEIREKGIVFDKSNFQAYNFSAAFAIEDRKVQISFPVVLPSLQGAADVTVSNASIPGIAAPGLRSLATIVPDTLRAASTQIPNLAVVGFSLKVPNLEGQELIVPPIPGVIVIPGDIGFLNQYFSVMLMVGNVAPDGSNLVVTDLKAQIVLPPGNDTVVGSGDDPLGMARLATGEAPRIRAIVQPGPDGKLGTADDIVTIGPGETGNAEFLVEGRREGSHVIEMEISGTLLGLPIGPVPIRGRAAGAVLVRNPKFTLTFTHPEAVAAGEPYTLDVTVTNTSESPANFVSVNLYPRNVSGATIVPCGPDDAPGTCGPTRDIESIPPGDSASITFNLISRLTGKVTAATLDSDENVSGRFGLKAAVGELSVPVSPDSLVLPKEANALPRGLREAAIGLLGKAYAVATAPAAALPKDVRRFSKKIVLDRAVEVAEAGFRTALHEPLADSAAQLAMDFAGSNVARLSDFYPKAEDLAFERDNFVGFDELRRRSVRGDVFAQAVASQLNANFAALGLAAFHQHLADIWSYRPAHLSVAISTSSGPLPFRLVLVDSQGRRVGAVDSKGKIAKEIPFSDYLVLGDAGGPTGQMAVVAAPEPGRFSIRLERMAAVPDAPITLSVVVPDAAGQLRHIVFDNVSADRIPAFDVGAADPFPLTVDVLVGGVPVTGQPLASTASAPVVDPPPTILGVVQQAQADLASCSGFQLGRIVAVLFSEEVSPSSAQDKLSADAITRYGVDGNRVVGVALQPGRRIAFLALRDPIGPYVARSLTVADVTDLRGLPMASATLPIETTVSGEGGVVSGRVINADGTPVKGANVRLYSLDPCEPIPVWVGLSSKNTGDDGRYGWDYVSRPLLDRIVAVDPETDEFRDLKFTVSRNGQRLNVDVVMLGRGTLQGVTRAEDGRLLADTAIRVTSLTDNSKYGAITDASGRFTIARIPVGNIFIEAVNVAAIAQLSVSERIPTAGGTVFRDITLLDQTRPETIAKYGSLGGHVLRSDGATPASGVPVYVYYQSLSQPGVACPSPGECAVAAANTDEAGAFSFDHLPAGALRVYTFDQAAYQQGEARIVVAADGSSRFNILLSGGFGTVNGIVLDPGGHPVAGASVGGGLALTTTDATGHFTLTDVPVGLAHIVAVSQILHSSASVTVDVVRAGETVNATLVLGAVGSVAGQVFLSNGTTPVPDNKVYVFQSNGGRTINIVGEATTDASGRYTISGVPAGQYTVSAFNASFTAGNLAKAVIKFDQQVFKADIVFRSGGGSVSGVVLGNGGNTPLKARVGISGDRIIVAGGKVGAGFQFVRNFRILDTDFTGRFSFGDLLVGRFTVTAAGQFSPDPISGEGEIPSEGAAVEINLILQPTGRITGTVFQPDGVTPAGSDLVVTFHSDATRTVCTETSGDTECVTIPQGIQSEIVVTTNGKFSIPIANPGAFTITIEDPASLMTAEVHGTLKPGETLDLSARLLGIGDLTVLVMGADGTPIPGAKVEVAQVGYPKKALTRYADATNGAAVFAGGDAFTEGQLVVLATDVRNGFAGRASGAITRDGEQVTLRVYLFDAVGAVYGTVFGPDGLTPVPNAEVVLTSTPQGGSSGPLAFTLADADGRYRVELVPLGSFGVEVFEAATARRGAGSGRIDLARQEVPVNIVEAALGMVTGTVLDSADLAPLKGWEVLLAQSSVGGLSLPTLTTTAGVDGRFSFPGTSRGRFSVSARKSNVNGSARADGIIDREGQVVDVPMVVSIIRPLFGSVIGTVLNPDGSPAANATVNICSGAACGSGFGTATTAGSDGTFAASHVALGRFAVFAGSQVNRNIGSTMGEVSFDGEVAVVTVVMTGVTQITGTVELASGGAAAGAEVVLSGNPSSGCPVDCRVYADDFGRFSFVDVPARTFSIVARDPVSGLKGVVGGPLNPGEQKTVRIVLEPTGSISGRLLGASGPAQGIVGELVVGTSSERHLFAVSGDDGTFSFDTVPMGNYTLELQDPIGPGLARRSGQVTGAIQFGDIVLDEASPAIAQLIPAASAVGVPLAQAVRITFTEPITPGTINLASVTLNGPTGPIVGTLVVSDGDTVVTLTPLTLLKDQTRFTLKITGVTDRLGKVMKADYTATFTTVDITPASVLDLSPAAGTSGVPIYTPVRVSFSEPIDPTKFPSPALTLTGPAGLVQGRIDYLLGNTTVVFTPNVPLAENATYRLQMPPAVDLAGNVPAAGLDVAFSTTDRTPPQVAGLTADHGGRVIENATARVAADVGVSHDVAVVDFYINDVFAFADRIAPFEVAFQATPELGHPGEQIKVAAIATDTSGNRGATSAPVYVEILTDLPPVVSISAPADGLFARNGDRVVVSVQATDDLGLTQVGFKAHTGRPQDSAIHGVTPASTSRIESFAFAVPADAVPGSTLLIEASASDTKGQISQAVPVGIVVLDATPPTVAITGATTGSKVSPGQQTTIVVAAQDLGGVASVTFTAGGVAAFSEVRPVNPAQNSVVTSFTVSIPGSAEPGQTVFLDAVAVDKAGNSTAAARVILPVADTVPPTVQLRTASGRPDMVPGRTLDLIAEAQDTIGVARIEISGQGAFTVSDAKQISPPLGDARVTFSIQVPVGLDSTAVLNIQARAFDIAGNASLLVSLTVTANALPAVAMPASTVLMAGESKDIAVELPGGAPAGGLRVDLVSGDPNVVSVVPSLTFAEGETSKTATISGVSGGSVPIEARIQGVQRTSMTVTVVGGVVSGLVFDDLLNPVAGAQVTVSSGWVPLAVVSDADGRYSVAGATGFDVSVKAVDPISHMRGSASAHLNRPNGYAKNVNVVLIAAGGVAGTVFAADGVTPGGAGVQVDIFDQANLSQSLNTTFSDADSHYEFPVVTQGSYIIDARGAGGKRGRTTATVAAGQDATANISYLGVGTITGVVRDGGSVPVPNAPVVLSASSVFGGSPETTIAAGADGSFSFPSVFVGSFWIRTSDPRNSQAGVASGVVGHDQETVPIDVYVASFGSLQGTVFRSDGTTTVANAYVAVEQGNTHLWATADSNGHYELPVVPLGTCIIDATEAATRGAGRTTATIAANGVAVTANVVLRPQGTLVVTVTDATSQIVAGAGVAVTSSSGGFGDSQSAVTGSDGRVVILHVLAGAFTVTVSNNGLSGRTTGTLAGGATLQVAVRLEPVASIAGTVLRPDGQTPAAGFVQLRQSSSLPYHDAIQQTTLAADGSYRFDGVPAGTFKIYAYDEGSRWRAVSQVVSLATQGQVATANLTFVGLGTVSGRVLNIDSSSAGDTLVDVRSLNPTFGGFRSTRTNAAGYYEVTGVAVGSVAVIAGSVAQGVFAETTGTLAADGQTVVIDLILKNSSTYFPVTLYDANGMTFEVGADGMVTRGQNYVFNAANGGGLKLEVESGGVTTPFAGTTIGTLEASGRQVVARQQGIAGLDVTRRIFVPIDGYFARYVDVLSNPGSSPVTVNVWLTSYVQASTVVRTSSGDAVLNVVDAATADRWITIDDSSDAAGSAPALALVFDGVGGATRAATAGFAPSNSTVWRWNSVTVPPGGRVAFLHFVAQQDTRAAAQATAERLVQLPPEALANMRQDELAAIQNFAVPADGVSTLAALPSVAGVIAGQALESDNLTPVPWTPVRFTSVSPYFARTLTFYADASGLFRLESNLGGTGNAIAVPVDGFSLAATYPGTNVAAPGVTGTFASGESLATENIVFTTTAGVRGSVRRSDGTVVTSGTVIAAGTWNGAGYNRTVAIGADGSFAFVGQPPVALVLTATVPHPQGSGVTGTASATLTAGQTQDVLITLSATGIVQGTVRNGGGAGAASVSVRLTSASVSRTATTDTAGAYTLAGVPVGAYSIAATEPASGLSTSASVTVAGDQTTTQDLQLVSVGIVRGTVKDASSAIAANVPVDLVTSVTARGTLRTTTNTSGAYQFSGVPLGSFLVSATNATLGQYGEVAGSVTSDGEQVVADITMASNILSLPRTVYDANSLPYDIQQNGRIRAGYGGTTFRGPSYYAADPYGASLLTLVSGGTETAFAGAATAVGEHGNRELAITQQGIAGLDVTRKVYTPDTGYFTRYLEILSNPGAVPVTIGVKVASTLGYAAYTYWWGYQGTRPSIMATSSGDALLDVTGEPADRWIVFDDSTQTDVFNPGAGGGFPASAFVIDGPGASQRVAAATFTTPYWGLLSYQWDSVTVPAGGKVILMHFVLQQGSTAAATASVQRLVQLPPEAISGIAENERPLVANFSVPADGSSTLAPLPSLTGTVTGNLLEVDGTAVPYSTVKFVSSSPYFSRVRTVWADDFGAFQFTSQFGQYGNTAIPIDAFTLTALHRVSSIESPPAAGSFPANRSAATQNVVFTNTATVTGYLRRHTGAAVPNNGVQTTSGTGYYQSSDGTGLFTFRGLTAGTWTLQATLASNSWLTGTSIAVTTAGQTTTQDLTFAPSGSVRGVVLDVGGAPSYTAAFLRRADGNTRYGYNGDGSFTFPDMPPGNYTLYATDGRTNATTEIPVTVVQDQETVQNITLPAAGSLQVQVNFARGAAAGGVQVQVKDAGTGGGFSRTIWVDAAGRGTVDNVAAGAVTVRAYHPSNSTFYSDVDVTVSSEGQVVPVTVTLPGVVTIKAHAAVSTGTAVPSTQTYLYQSSQMSARLLSATTDSTGTSTLGFVATGTNYVVTGERHVSSYNGYYVTGQSAAFTPATDGETVTVEVPMPAVARTTVAVVKPDGTSYGSTWLYVRNAYQPNFWGECSTSSSTGLCTMSMPEGAYTIRVYDYNTGVALVDYTGTIAAADEGQTTTATIVIGALTGTVTGQIFAADGATPIVSSRVYLINAIDQQEIASMIVGADGRYTFSNRRAGAGGFMIRAALPSSANDTTTVDVPGSFSTAGETVTLNVTMPFASVTLGGTVYAADGTTPIPSAPVRILNLAGTIVASTTATSSGTYGPITVLASTSGVRVRAYDRAIIVSGEQLQVPGSSGGTFTVNVTIPVYSASLQGYVRAADGQTGVRYAALTLQTAAGTIASFSADATGHFSATVFAPTGGSTLSAWYSNGVVSDRTPASIPLAFASMNAVVNVDFTLPLSVVIGHMRYADRSTQVNLRDGRTVGADSQTRDFMTVDFTAGTLVILGTPPGPFRTYVTDAATPYFTGFADATMGDITVPVNVDVILPASGTINVRMLDATGQPVTGNLVALSAPGAPLINSYPTDASGHAVIPAPAGPVSLQGCPNNEGCSVVSGTVTAGQTLHLDLAPRPTGTLEGRLFKTDGVTPYSAGTGVWIESEAGSGNLGYWYGSGGTDADGRFSVTGVPAGIVYVQVNDYSVQPPIRVPVTIVAGKTNTMQASAGTGVRSITLTSGSATFNPGMSGNLSTGTLGTSVNPYYDSYRQSVNGISFSARGVARWLSTGTQLEISPANASALIVGRKLGVPGNKPYVRYLETVYNPTAVPLPVSVQIYSYVRDVNVVTGPAATGNRYVITGPPVGGTRAMVGHVIAGAGTPQVATGVALLPNSSFDYVWSTVVPPGGTVEFMHFSVLWDPADVAGLQAQAQALVDLTDPDALFGLSDEEKGRILNFNIPGGKPVRTGNIRGAVMAQDGTTPIAGATVQAMDAFTGYPWATSTTGGDGAFQFDNVPTGDYGIAVAATLAGFPGKSAGAAVNFTQAGQTVSDLVLTFPMGEVSGRVTASGAGVASPTVLLAQTDALGTVSTRPAYLTGADGHYVVLGLEVGAFTLTAIDSNGQAGTTVQGTYDGIHPVSLDVALPGGATCVVPPVGLKGFWRGEADAQDSVHAGNNGALQGGSAIGPARVGNGFALDGNTGLVTIPDDLGALRPTMVTVGAWVKFNSLDSATSPSPGEQEIVFKKKGTIGPNGWFEGYALAKTRLGPGDDRFRFYLVTPSEEQDLRDSQISKTSVEAGRFYHVVGTSDGAVGRLYVNGLLEATFPFPYSVDAGTGPLVIGGTGDPFWDPRCDCVIDEVQVFDRALGPDEVQAMFAATTAGVCTDLQMLPKPLPVGYTGVDATDRLRALNGLPPVTFSASATPPGMSVASDGRLTGVPTTAGSFTFNVTATDATFATAAREYSKAIWACLVLPTGAVSLWSAENDATDSFGVNNGTLVGPTFTTGKSGRAFYFSGFGQYVGRLMSPLDLADTFTVEFWAWPLQPRNSTTEGTSGETGIIGQRYAITPEYRDGGAGAGVSVGTDGISVFEHGAGYLPSLLVYNTTLTGWTHVAVVYENKVPKLYVNGSLARTGLTSLQPYVYAPTGFGDPYGYGPYWGSLDEVALYSRALTSAEIQQIYAAGGEVRCKTVIR